MSYEYITDLQGADPVGPWLAQLHDSWATNHVERRKFVSVVHAYSMDPLRDFEIDEEERPLNFIVSGIYLRERAIAYADHARNLRETVRGAHALTQDDELFERIDEYRSQWLRDDDLRNAVDKAIAVAEQCGRWFSIQWMGDMLARKSRMVFRRPVFQDMEPEELQRQCLLVSNFAFMRGKLMYQADFMRALEALYFLPVLRGSEPIKELFSLVPDDITLLGQGRMGLAREKVLAHFDNKRKASQGLPEADSTPEPDPPTQQVDTVLPDSGLVIVTTIPRS